MIKVFIVPKKGLVVRDPTTAKQIPSEGIEIELSRYWRRRISDGDVKILDNKKKGGKTFEKSK